jgi:hypothetical protein
VVQWLFLADLLIIISPVRVHLFTDKIYGAFCKS